MSEFKLVKEIIKRSKADSWALAVREWELSKIEYLSAEHIEEFGYETCLCRHYPIRELCYLHNSDTKENVVIGNCCVKKFPFVEFEDFDKIFQALSEERINKSVIKFTYSRLVINNWEYEFITKMLRKRKFSYKQDAKREEITDRIMRFFLVSE